MIDPHVILLVCVAPLAFCVVWFLFRRTMDELVRLRDKCVTYSKQKQQRRARAVRGVRDMMVRLGLYGGYPEGYKIPRGIHLWHYQRDLMDHMRRTVAVDPKQLKAPGALSRASAQKMTGEGDSQ